MPKVKLKVEMEFFILFFHKIMKNIITEQDKHYYTSK